METIYHLAISTVLLSASDGAAPGAHTAFTVVNGEARAGKRVVIGNHGVSSQKPSVHTKLKSKHLNKQLQKQ